MIQCWSLSNTLRAIIGSKFSQCKFILKIISCFSILYFLWSIFRWFKRKLPSDFNGTWEFPDEIFPDRGETSPFFNILSLHLSFEIFFNYNISPFSFFPSNPPIYSFPVSFKFTVSVFINCYYMHVYICIFLCS